MHSLTNKKCCRKQLTKASQEYERKVRLVVLSIANLSPD